MSARVFLLLLLCMFAPAYLLAQPMLHENHQGEHIRYMVLDKSWPVYRVRFFPGQTLMFKLKNESGWHRGKIQMVHKHSLVIMDSNIPFSEIKKIRVQRRGYWIDFANLSASSFMGGGVVMILAGSVNAIQNRNGEGATIAYVGATAMALGSGMRLLTKRTYRIRGNRRLRSI